MLRSWEQRSQACQHLLGYTERAAPLLKPPAGNGGDRAIVQQFDIVGDLHRDEIAHQVQRLQDFFDAARRFRPVQDIDERAFDHGTRTASTGLSVHGRASPRARRKNTACLSAAKRQ